MSLRRRALIAAAVCITVVSVWSGWTGHGWFPGQVAVVGGGVCSVLAGLFLALRWLLRRSDGGGARGPFPLVPVLLAAWLAITAGSALEANRWSLQTSFRRGEEFLDLLLAFERKHDRLPASRNELAADAGRPLPEPTLDDSFSWGSWAGTQENLEVTFWQRGEIMNGWVLDGRTRVWRRFS